MIRTLKPQRNDIIQALMGSLPIVMMLNLPEYVAKMLFSQENQVIQRLPCFTHVPVAFPWHSRSFLLHANAFCCRVSAAKSYEPVWFPKEFA
jgi:hypothetical protein